MHRANLLGYSQGARFALATALRQPSALVGSSWRVAHRACTVARSARSGGPRTRSWRPSSASGAWRPSWSTGSPCRSLSGLRKLPAEQQHSLRERRRGCTEVGLAGALECLGLGVQPDYWPELQRQRLPTLLLTGALDVKFTQIARQMAAELPVVWRRTFEDCSHAPHLEHPEEYVPGSGRVPAHSLVRGPGVRYLSR